MTNYSVLPFPYQWDGDFETEAQLIVTQYQQGVRQTKLRNRINHTLDKGVVRVYAPDFATRELLELFLQTYPGRPFQLALNDVRLWRCMKYSKELSGSTGQTFFTLELMQVHKTFTPEPLTQVVDADGNLLVNNVGEFVIANP